MTGRETPEPAGVRLELDERSNAVDYLARAIDYVEAVPHDPLAWKWVAIALHGAVYGFAVCAVRGSDSDSPVDVTKRGHRRLIDFNTALERAQHEAYFNYTFNKAVVLTDDEKGALAMLNVRLRNEFQHFQPKFLTIDTRGMPRIVLDTLNVIEKLVAETAEFIFDDEGHRDRIAELIERGRSAATPMSETFGKFEYPPCTHSWVVTCSDCGDIYCMNCSAKLDEVPEQAERHTGVCGDCNTPDDPDTASTH